MRGNTLTIVRKSGEGGSGNANIFEATISLTADTAQNITVAGATKLTLIDVWTNAGENIKGNLNITKAGNVATLTAYENWTDLQVNIAYS